jgi:hypothetical protein
MEQEAIYMYYSNSNIKLYTPNYELAVGRARAHGTYNVYIV